MNRPDDFLAIRSGDENAFVTLYEAWRSPLARCVLRYVADEAEAEDVVQSTFLSLWANRARLPVDLEFPIGAFLRTAAIRSALMRRRAEHRFEHAMERYRFVAPTAHPPADRVIEARETIEALDAAVEQLSASRRRVFRARMGGVDERTLAEVLGVTRDAIKRAYRLARLDLRRFLAAHIS